MSIAPPVGTASPTAPSAPVTSTAEVKVAEVPADPIAVPEANPSVTQPSEQSILQENADLRQRVYTLENEVRALTEALADENRRLYAENRVLRNAVHIGDYDLGHYDVADGVQAFTNCVDARRVLEGKGDGLRHIVNSIAEMYVTVAAPVPVGKVRAFV